MIWVFKARNALPYSINPYKISPWGKGSYIKCEAYRLKFQKYEWKGIIKARFRYKYQ